jgi:chemotaxis protein methyltransferase CheR
MNMPQSGLSAELLSELNTKLTSQLGIHHSPERLKDLERNLKHIAHDFKFKQVTDCLEWLVRENLTPQQWRMLAIHLTVGETYFFRNPALFDLLEHEVLPALIHKRRQSDKRLVIWSAGCATGEEPYSIAILLTKLIPDLADWTIRIHATDVNHRFLAKARVGTYTEWSMRACPPQLRSKFFRERPDSTCEIQPSLKSLVEFSELNLVDLDSYYQILSHGQIDIILCCNVFIYFTETAAQGITQRMHQYLSDDGYLFVGPNEFLAVTQQHFKRKSYPGGTYFKKEAGHDLAPLPNLGITQTRKPRRTLATDTPITVRPRKPVAATTQEIQKTQKSRPDSASAKDLSDICATARSLAASASWKKIIALLLPLNEQGQNSAESAALLSQAYANQNSLSEALLWITKAIEMDTLNSAYYYQRAIILDAQNATEEAIVALRQTLFLSPDNVMAQFTIANLFKKTGKATRARRHFKIAQGLLLKNKEEDLVLDSDGLTTGALSQLIDDLSRPSVSKGRE